MVKRDTNHTDGLRHLDKKCSLLDSTEEHGIHRLTKIKIRRHYLVIINTCIKIISVSHNYNTHFIIRLQEKLIKRSGTHNKKNISELRYNEIMLTQEKGVGTF